MIAAYPRGDRTDFKLVFGIDYGYALVGFEATDAILVTAKNLIKRNQIHMIINTLRVVIISRKSIVRVDRKSVV